jgi:hypothetical protein
MVNGRMPSSNELGKEYREIKNHEISQDIHPPGQNSKPRTLKTKQKQ